MIEKIISEMPKREDFDFWFEFETSKRVRCKQIVPSTEPVKSFVFDIHNHPEVPANIISEFEKFEKRPEYICIAGNKVGWSLSDLFDIHVLAVCLNDADKPRLSVAEIDETGIKQYRRVVDWLRTTDFYEAPASTKYHGSYPHGLLQHTLEVVDLVKELKFILPFQTTSMNSAIKCAMVHDWCKINQYEPYDKWIKDKDGRWVKDDQPAYRWKDSAIPLGHGVSSLFIAGKLFSLSTEEAMAIRWHMGHWRVCDDEVGELQQANETYPLVHLLQFADQLSIVKY